MIADWLAEKTLWKYELRKIKESVAIFIAWRLPRYLVMWCAIRLIAYSTQGEYGNTIVPGLTAMDALQRWDE